MGGARGRGHDALIEYTPPLSVVPFFTSKKLVSLIVGSVGSTKTTASMLKIAYEAKQIAACKDGVRRSRCVVVRNTRQILFDSTIPDFLKWFPDGQAGIFMKTESKFLLKFDDVECEVLFRGLDDANDVRRLLSVQLSFGVLDEFREINKDIYEALAGRLGRYPDGMMVPHRPHWGLDEKGNPVQGCVDDNGKPMKKLWGASNPPDLDTFWEGVLTDPPDNMHVTIQPSAMDPKADWLHLLPTNYYEDLMELHKGDPDWIDVFIHAQFGKSLAGKPVFRCFDRTAHVANKALVATPASINPLIIGFDCTGLNPAAVIGQVGFQNRLYILDALYANEMGALRFIREVLKPLVVSRFAGMRAVVIIDPAGMNRGNDEKNVADLLKAEGFVVKAARTNGIAARLAAVEHFLTRMVGGQSGILIDPRCKELIAGLAGKYRYKVNTKGETADTPDKTHPYADIQDALQYLCLHADGGTIFGAEIGGKRREIKPATVRFR